MSHFRESRERIEAVKGNVPKRIDFSRQQFAPQIDGGTTRGSATSSGYNYGLGRPVEPTAGFASLQRSQTNYLDSLQRFTRKTGMFGRDRNGKYYRGKPYRDLASYPPALDRVAQLDQPAPQEHAEDRPVEQIRSIDLQSLTRCIVTITKRQRGKKRYTESDYNEVVYEHKENKRLIVYHNFSELNSKMDSWRNQSENIAKQEYASKFWHILSKREN